MGNVLNERLLPDMLLRPVRGILQINFLLIMTALLSSGCDGGGGGDSDGGSELTSTLGDNDSHRAGQDCQRCHRSGGSGDGVFTIAGTVFDGDNPSVVKPNVIVRLFALPDQSSALIEEIEVDAKGNFYTTAPIPYGAGLFAVLVDGPVSSPFMMAPVTASEGACNSCHDGNAVPVLFIN